MIIHTIQLENKDGFNLTFNALEEHLSLSDTFDNSVTDLKELAYKIDSCQLVYFCAQVIASKNGIKLGDSYLGACCYESYDDFITGEDYIEDMKDAAIKEAKQAIASLIEGK
jgi:hypothetical protein